MSSTSNWWKADGSQKGRQFIIFSSTGRQRKIEKLHPKQQRMQFIPIKHLKLFLSPKYYPPVAIRCLVFSTIGASWYHEAKLDDVAKFNFSYQSIKILYDIFFSVILHVMLIRSSNCKCYKNSLCFYLVRADMVIGLSSVQISYSEKSACHWLIKTKWHFDYLNPIKKNKHHLHLKHQIYRQFLLIQYKYVLLYFTNEFVSVTLFVVVG